MKKHKNHICIKIPKMPELSRDTKEYIKTSSFVFGIVFFIVAIIAIGEASSSTHEKCEKTYKYDYVFPFRKLGCWLGKEVQ